MEVRSDGYIDVYHSHDPLIAGQKYLVRINRIDDETVEKVKLGESVQPIYTQINFFVKKH